MEQLTSLSTQQAKAKEFHRLHHNGKLLILPNIWDCLGALLLEDMEYPAIATASASIAFSNGYDDGENIPFNDLLILLKRIANAVNVPVTADIESGYAENDGQLKTNIQQLLAAGIVGINIEDTDKRTRRLLPIEAQSNKIKLIKKTSTEMGVPLFINARTDVYTQPDFDSPESKLEETIKRGAAYKEAGADCFFPLAIQKENDINQLIGQLSMPINILLIPGVPELNVLQASGVARVSLGPSFLKIAIKAMKDLAMQLREQGGLASITGNPITSDYLRSLVNKK